MMTKRLASILGSATLALALGACGGDGGSLDAPSDAVLASINASCEKAFDCKSSYDASMHDGDTFESQYGNSVSDCVTQTKALITAFLGADYFDKLDASADAGRIHFDGGDAQVCLDSGSAQSCDQFFGQNGASYTPPPECDSALAGTVPTGGACTIDEDCATDGDDCTDGTCTGG